MISFPLDGSATASATAKGNTSVLTVAFTGGLALLPYYPSPVGRIRKFLNGHARLNERLGVISPFFLLFCLFLCYFL